MICGAVEILAIVEEVFLRVICGVAIISVFVEEVLMKVICGVAIIGVCRGGVCESDL